MPALADLQLPAMRPGSLQGEDAARIKSYLYQLTEQLRYVLGNLDEENLSAGLAGKIEGGGLGTEVKQELAAITLKAAGQDGALSQLRLSLAGLGATVQGQDGRISELSQTASSLQAAVKDEQENASRLSQSVEALQTTVQRSDGELSTLRQTAEALQTTVQGQGQSISSLTQTRDSLALEVHNDTDSATITLTGAGVSAQGKTIRFTGEVVFKNDLQTAGRTAINGANITTGSLDASLLKTGTIQGAAGTSSWNLDDGTLVSGSSAGTHVTVCKDNIRWYKDGSLTGVVRSVIGSTYYTANSTYCYLGWCNNEANGFAYGGHGLHTLPWSGMWPNDGNLDISVVTERGLAVHGELRVPTGSIEASGHISCGGAKTRRVQTSFGTTHLFAMESPAPAFLDCGSGITDEAGLCCIQHDPRYAETVAGEVSWWVTPTGAPGMFWVEKMPWGAVVHGPAGAAFDWMCRAAQTGYESWYADPNIDEVCADAGGAALEEENARYIEALFSEMEEVL